MRRQYLNTYERSLNLCSSNNTRIRDSRAREKETETRIVTYVYGLECVGFRISWTHIHKHKLLEGRFACIPITLNSTYTHASQSVNTRTRACRTPASYHMSITQTHWYFTQRLISESRSHIHKFTCAHMCYYYTHAYTYMTLDGYVVESLVRKYKWLYTSMCL